VAQNKRRCRTFRYRLHPTFRQTQALLRQLDYQRELYNAALEERVVAWNWERRSVNYVAQRRTLTGLSDVRPEVVASGVTLCRGTLERLDWAFDAFFRRMKSGETPGFPRFKSAGRFHSLQWEDKGGWKVKNEARRLYLLGIGEIKANYHRPLLGTPKTITVKREGAKWWVSVHCVDVPAAPLDTTSREVGLDLGIANLVTTSDGELIVGEHFGSRAQAQLTLAQQRLATKQRGSNRRRHQVEVVARLHRKVAQQRRNAAHQLSRRLVNDYDLIVLEDLAIVSMVQAPKAKPDPDVPGAFLPNGAAAKAGLNRSIHDAGWGTAESRSHRNELGKLLHGHHITEGCTRSSVEASLNLHEVFD
jgi:putative transposase